MVAMRVTGHEKFLTLARHLKGPAAANLRKDLNRQLRVAVQPAIADVKSTVRSLPVRSVGGGGTAQRRAHRAGRGRSHGLRSTIAAGVRMEARYGGAPSLRIVVRPNLPGGQRTLPRHLNKPGGWRHPVWGHRDRWVKQVGGPYFDRVIFAHRQQMTADVVKALEQTARTIAYTAR